jgi:hypothetical protein
MTEIRSYITVEMVMEGFKWSRELSQQFLDVSVARGISIPIEDGKYITKSEKVLEQARHMREILDIFQGKKRL